MVSATRIRPSSPSSAHSPATKEAIANTVRLIAGALAAQLPPKTSSQLCTIGGAVSEAGHLAVPPGVYFAARTASICSEAFPAPSSSPIRSDKPAARPRMPESSMEVRIAAASRSGVSFFAGSGSGPAPAR
jgi:hypothetical protein